MFAEKVLRVRPDRLIVLKHKSRNINDVYQSWESGLEIKRKKLENLLQKKKSYELSEQSKRKIRDSVASLYFNSAPRTVRINSKKFIYNYRCSFVTLTLPAVQIHSDVCIKKCLNLFLNRLRGLGHQNYLWKAELQENENIHFHLVLDKYISWGKLCYFWNLSINSLGYVDRYADKMNKLTFQEYRELRENDDFEVVLRGWKRGCQTGWKKPNTVDVRSIYTDSNLAYYVSKYITKTVKKENDDYKNINVERVEAFGKVWSRSQSLSRLNFKNGFDFEEVKDLLKKLVDSGRGYFYYLCDYCEVYFLRLKDVPIWFRNWHRALVWSFAKSDGYPFPYSLPIRV